MRSYANNESLTKKGNLKTRIMEIKEGRVYLFWTTTSQFLCKFSSRRNEAGSCSSGCDVIICKLGPLHPERLSMLENTHYGNQFDERLNSFTGLVRI
jgi:hypothetical protein